ncbi:beta-ketoacyl synthase chain length factor [Catalinimonas niigatensis]|uniref:beta-ketoacyl synthase chain length factor n=1 Tax=Catalinimonas niigatensis TaxID=1397264 RepID=UPI00266617D9|nr:beta-ketoacyl synthase chain length factor [Catalinimonas niigatensis]WPP48766.1 beta-ketoacyl synthase chain length factor [Catalinimonas niigatensis]
MKAYITAASAISPQHSFQEDAYLLETVLPEHGHFTAIEPVYRDYIDPKLSRRMSRVIKMSVTCAQQCLKSVGIAEPEAIIVGTGLGCLQDTEKFLLELLENQEGLLSPTAFIQSTHNTIAGQIALTLNCSAHNFTYVQRAHSFEKALEDGLLHVQEGKAQVLLGGVDEITPTLYEILAQAGCTGKSENPSLNFPNRWGEGASFFLLSAGPSENSLACIEGTASFYHPSITEEELVARVQEFLENHHLSFNTIDAVMLGMQSDMEVNALYHHLYDTAFSGKLLLQFKNLCGEYFTASAFAHQLAARVLQKQQVFKSIKLKGEAGSKLDNILFYNHYQGKYHTFSLLSRCQPSR